MARTDELPSRRSDCHVFVDKPVGSAQNPTMHR